MNSLAGGDIFVLLSFKEPAVPRPNPTLPQHSRRGQVASGTVTHTRRLKLTPISAEKHDRMTTRNPELVLKRGKHSGEDDRSGSA